MKSEEEIYWFWNMTNKERCVMRSFKGKEHLLKVRCKSRSSCIFPYNLLKLKFYNHKFIILSTNDTISFKPLWATPMQENKCVILKHYWLYIINFAKVQVLHSCNVSHQYLIKSNNCTPNPNTAMDLNKHSGSSNEGISFVLFCSFRNHVYIW